MLSYGQEADFLRYGKLERTEQTSTATSHVHQSISAHVASKNRDMYCKSPFYAYYTTLDLGSLFPKGESGNSYCASATASVPLIRTRCAWL